MVVVGIGYNKNMVSKSKYLVFEVAGDPCKDLVATAVVRNLKHKYPDREIIVTTLFLEIGRVV